MDLGSIAVKGYSAFPESLSITEASLSIVLVSCIEHSLWGSLTPP